MPANNSITLLIKVEMGPSLEYSPKRMEMGREKKVEIARAKKDTNKVPTINGSAPNSLLTGSQVVLMRNPRPKLRIEGMEANTNDKKIANKRIRTEAPIR
jgi:hypothetical protein